MDKPEANGKPQNHEDTELPKISQETKDHADEYSDEFDMEAYLGKKRMSCEIKAPHFTDGHTFLVTTIMSDTVTTTTRTSSEREVHHSSTPPTLDYMNLRAIPVEKHIIEECTETKVYANEAPICSSTSKAIVPLSSSLPSKLLRYHAKRSAQALLHQVESQQSQSMDSQFGSEEGATGGADSDNDSATNDCADIFDIPTPTAPSMSPTPANDEKLIDVGMGSSIEGSEESEEDDELKPLAVDNHVLHDVDATAICERPVAPAPMTSSQSTSFEPIESASTMAVLSEANLEKFHKHNRSDQQQPNGLGYYNVDNIYLHPNFQYELDNTGRNNSSSEASPPPAIAPANSPIEQKRIHRSFLTMKKPTAIIEVEQANSVLSQATSATSNPDANSEQPLVNEIDTLDPSLIPSDELAAEITEAVEFYFSNESILKDAFLLKHVRRNKEGFVSLKLVSSFKRVRQLTKDWKVVGNAVRRKSHKIELNELGTKVRRIESLPNFDETMPSRTIVACDLPLDKLSIEKVSDIFSKCGEIALIRILKPGMAIPVDVRQFMNKYPEMQQKECALVEYLESSSARDALSLQGPFQVFEMVAPKKKTGKKAIIQLATPVTRMVENYRYYNDATYERTRGGSFSGIMPPHDADLRYRLKHNNSEVHGKTYGDMHYGGSHAAQYYHQPQQPQHYNHHHPHSPTHRGSFGSDHMHHQYQPPHHQYQPRGSISHEAVTQAASSPGHNMNFYNYAPRRYSNSSTISANTAAAGGEPATGSNNNNNVLHNSGNNINHNNTSNNNLTNIGSNTVRRLSNCSDNHSSYSEMSRRPSNCSESMSQRRDSNCSENCPCSRRISDFGQTEVYRKTSQSSIGSGGGGGGERRFSNGSLHFERTFSTSSGGGDGGVGNGAGTYPRRMSNDFNYERKPSLEPQTNVPPYDNIDGNVGGGGGGYNVFPRRYSNNFNVSSKLAAYDNAQYINGRRISTDSGYDRRCSFGSEYEGSPRSRTSSFLNNYKHGGVGGGGAIMDYDGSPRSRTGSFLDGSPRSRSGSFAQRNAENLVRTPIGPDGSKGFGSRARKFGQTVSPV